MHYHHMLGLREENLEYLFPQFTRCPNFGFLSEEVP